MLLPSKITLQFAKDLEKIVNFYMLFYCAWTFPAYSLPRIIRVLYLD